MAVGAWHNVRETAVPGDVWMCSLVWMCGLVGFGDARGWRPRHRDHPIRVAELTANGMQPPVWDEGAGLFRESRLWPAVLDCPSRKYWRHARWCVRGPASRSIRSVAAGAFLGLALATRPGS